MIKPSRGAAQRLVGSGVKDLSLTLRAHREEILTRCAILCRQNPRAQPLTDEQLLDHLPRLLDRLAAGVEAASEGRDTTFPITAIVRPLDPQLAMKETEPPRE